MGLRYLGAEVPIRLGCRIDLLAEDKKTNALVGIELKVAEPKRNLTSEAGTYMDALKQKSAAEGRPTRRLLIVTGQPHPEFQQQVQALSAAREVPIQWLIYTVSMTLKN